MSTSDNPVSKPAKPIRPAPNVFGHVDLKNNPIGRTWPDRLALSASGIHPAPMAGIYGRSEEGAFSIALSGGYEDDVDKGETFTYTGCGGRDLYSSKTGKRLRVGPQAYDQTFDHFLNRSLQVSSYTGNPVRVVRGFQLKSIYAPSEGYRYDGLYKVTRAWTEKGLAGFLVCRYAFQRLPDQPPLPIRPPPPPPPPPKRGRPKKSSDSDAPPKPTKRRRTQESRDSDTSTAPRPPGPSAPATVQANHPRSSNWQPVTIHNQPQASYPKPIRFVPAPPPRCSTSSSDTPPSQLEAGPSRLPPVVKPEPTETLGSGPARPAWRDYHFKKQAANVKMEEEDIKPKLEPDAT